MAESERPPGCDSPNPGGAFWQLVSPDSTFRLPEAMIFVGSAECDVLVKAKSVDKRHAVVMYDYCDKKFKVKDLNSANGTFVNEARIPVQTYIQLNSMDVLRFGFDSAVYQVVRVPDSREIATPKPPNELFIQEPDDIIKTPTTAQNGSRTPTRQEQKTPDSTQHLSTDLKMSGAVSSSSLHSAFSEDSLLGVNGLSHSPSGRVPVDAVRTLGPYGPQLDSWTHTSSRKSHTAPVRSGPGRSSFKEIRASFRGRNDLSAAATPPEEPVCKIVPSHSANLSLLAKKELKSKIVASASDHSITSRSNGGLRERPELSIFGTSKQKSKKEEEKVLRAVVPEVQIVAPPEKKKITGDGKLRIEDAQPLSPLFKKRKSEGAAPSVTTELPTPSEEASTPTSSGSTEPASSGKQSTDSSPTTSSHKPSGDDSTITASDAAQPPTSSSAASSPDKQPPPPSPSNYPLAFTIDFDDGKKLDIGAKLSKFAPKHIRNLSMSRHEEVKAMKQERATKGDADVKGKPSPPAVSPTAPSPAPMAGPVAAVAGAVPLLRRAGYHSEGYFSSDQDEDLSIKSDLTALKKNQEKILKPSTLTQDKKSKPVSSLALESNSPINRKAAAVGVERRTVSLEESASQHFAKILAEKSMASPEREWPESPDNVSETGTYTIDKDSPSPDEEKARSDIDAVFGVNEEDKAGYDARTFTRPKETRNGHNEPGASSSYRAGPNWIKEWAAQVAEQHSSQSLSPPTESVLPPIKTKGRAPSPVRAPKPTNRASPAPPNRNWAPPPAEPSAAGKGRYKLPSLSSPVASDFSDPSDNSPLHKRNLERIEKMENETESYLRATESVMTAMQARMTSQVQELGDSDEEGLSAGAVTAKSLTAQLRAKLKALEEKSVRSKHHAAIAAASPPPPPVVLPAAVPAKRLMGAKSKEERQSDSSSDAGDHKPRSRERSDSVGPQTRYNRAFSLRRARLEAEEAKTKTTSPPVKPTPVRPTPAPATKKKEPAKAVSKPPLSSSNFQRTDGGRFSLRAGKANTPQPPSAAAKGKPPTTAGKKEPAKKSNSSSGSGNRSNSNLCSKELEFQNWKRRKNYDPMKAAAEGKKKAVEAKKGSPGQGADVMTQSAIVMTHSSPNSSPLNSILRSASFHGTGAMASLNSSHNSNATSEDEATLSADEDLAEKSNNSISPRHMRLPPSPLRAVSQPPDNLNPRKKSLDEMLPGGSSMGFVRNTTPTSSVRSRGKFEALDNLVIAAIHGFSNKIKGSSHNVLGKLRVLFQEDQEKVMMLEDTLNLLEESEPASASPNKSPSKELSGTLRNLKKLEHVFNVLDEVLFGDEDLELRDEEEELSDLEEA